MLIIFSALLLLIVMLSAVIIGNYNTSLSEVANVIGSQLGLMDSLSNQAKIVVWEVRIPRIILAALTGMALSISGIVFQGVFRNPLVEPYVLGISSGAACGAALSIVFALNFFSKELMAFIFSIIAMLMVYTLATVKKQTPLVNLILGGMIVSAIFISILNLLKTIAPDSKLREITFWLMGGFYTADWEKVKLMLPLTLISLLILWSQAWKINVMTMGDSDARTMGISVGKMKILLLGISTLITSAAVAQVGIISWVGLMIPHMARMTIGSDHRYSIPFAASIGAAFMVVCDTIARSVVMGEIPVSIITSILGAPYLIYLIRTNRQVYFND